MDERIEFQELTEVNNSGEVVKSYVSQGSVWAKIVSQKGNESFESSRLGSKRTVKIQTRFRNDVKTTWRVLWDGESYNITDVDRSLRREDQLWLMCETSEAV